MKKKTKSVQICAICETGKQSLIKDDESLFCPYLQMLKDNTCSKFEKIKDKEKEDEI